MSDERALPYATEDLPGTGGVLRSRCEDFRVEETPSYEPTGTGDHIFVYIEKRNMTTAAAIDELARLAGVAASGVGAAGMKDKRAVTRQWLSLPPPASPEKLEGLSHPDLEILEWRRHGHKLRTGHLRGNRFRLILRDLTVPAGEAEAIAKEVLARLVQPPFAPNWFGLQRFGHGGGNAQVGRALVRGEPLPTRSRPRGRKRRFYISAYQSDLFNRYLRERICDRLLGTVVSGDVLAVRASGGIFVTDSPERDQGRFDAGEIAITGPMFGSKMRGPPDDSDAGRREASLRDAEGIEPVHFAHLGKLALGTRRPLAVVPEEVGASADGSALELRFWLPSGSYATALVREIIKGDRDFPE